MAPRGVAGGEAVTRRERTQEVIRFLDDIDELRGSGSVDWADDTLTGIYDTVGRQNIVTEGQRRAVDNIESAGQKRRPVGWG